MVVVDGRRIEDGDEAEKLVKSTVDALEREFSAPEFEEYVVRVTGKIDIDFLKSHTLALSEPAALQRFERLFSDLNLVPLFRSLNDDMEREYVGNEAALSDDEEIAVAQFRGLDRIFSLLEAAMNDETAAEDEISAVLDRFLFGDEYILSHDRRMAICIVEPAFTMDDIPVLVPGVNTIEATSKRIAAEVGITAGLTGITVVARDEMVTSEEGIVVSMLAAVVLILLLQVFTFRMFTVPLISGIPLLIGVLWTMGVTGYTIHRLNIMTAMYMVALVGLGIDYAIHLLTTFVQERDEGREFIEAMERAFAKSGVGIITGAATTSVAFFMLVVAETSLMRELGIVAGAGILCELAAMLLLIPGLLGLREHRRHRKDAGGEAAVFSKVHIRADLASGFGKFVMKVPALTAVLSLAACGLLATQIGKVQIETNLMKMEAKGLESVELQDTLVEEFDMAPDGLYLLSRDQREIERLHNELADLGSVERTDSVAPYVVSETEIQPLQPLIRAIGQRSAEMQSEDTIQPEMLLDELYRLQDNLLEMSDLAFLGGLEQISNVLNTATGWDESGAKVRETSLDRVIASLEDGGDVPAGMIRFQEVFVPLFAEKVNRMADPSAVSIEDLPESIRASYVSRDGDEFILSLIPTRNPWQEEFRKTFTGQVGSVTSEATGMILAADQLTIMARSDGVRASIAAVAVVFLILLIDFRNLKLAILTTVPLLCSFAALFGFMGLAGIKFDFVNIIAVPLLIGIGIDDAVHISHRYLYEGKGSMDTVIAKTGSAVLLTTLTTMIGFGSFIPSIMRAMRSTGIVLTIAMAIAFLFSVLLHPSILILTGEKLGLRFDPWGSTRKSATKGNPHQG